MSTHILTQPYAGLECLSLPQPKSGFRDFISCWLMRWDDHAIVVDPGPTRSIPHLVQQLHERGVERLDGVLLTHIHIDHAGGTGDLLKQIPVEWVQCHPKGIPHLIDPTKLWQGTKKVLGDLAEFYGAIAPISEDKISHRTHITLGSKEIHVVPTPGHAPHHDSFLIDKALFSGEVAGVVTPCEAGFYTRPATPPKFIKDIFLASIDRLLALPHLPEFICYGHYGALPNARHHIEQARTQFLLWCDVIQRMKHQPDEEILDALRAEDPLFQHHLTLEDDILEREHIFISNSIRGIRRFYIS